MFYCVNEFLQDGAKGRRFFVGEWRGNGHWTTEQMCGIIVVTSSWKRLWVMKMIDLVATNELSSFKKKDLKNLYWIGWTLVVIGRKLMRLSRRPNSVRY